MKFPECFYRALDAVLEIDPEHKPPVRPAEDEPRSRPVSPETMRRTWTVIEGGF